MISPAAAAPVAASPLILLVLLLSSILTSTTSLAEILHLTDNNFDSVLSAFPSSSSLVLFQSHDCRYCNEMRDEYENLSNDELVRDDRILVASVHGPSSPNLSLRFNIRSYPTIIYLRNGRMYEYRGEHTSQLMRSFVLKGYENQGEGVAIPSPITLWNRMEFYFKAARSELGDAARGELGMTGYAMVFLTGMVLGLVGVLMYVVAVVARRKLKDV